MKFFLVAAACIALAVAGPTRGILDPESAGPIPDEQEISNLPAFIPQEIDGEPAFVPQEIIGEPALIDDSIKPKSPLVQVVININSKSHVIEIPAEDASLPEGSEEINMDPALVPEHFEDINTDPALVPEIQPDPADIVDENINIGKPDLPLAPSPADLGKPELPGLDADNAQNIPDDLN